MKNNYIDDFIDFIKAEKGAKSWEDVVSYCWYNMTVFINNTISDEYYSPDEDPSNYYKGRLDRIVKEYYWSKYSDYLKYSISSFIRDLINLFADIVKSYYDCYCDFKYEYAEIFKEVLI
jgi:hypothetical protein